MGLIGSGGEQGVLSRGDVLALGPAELEVRTITPRPMLGEKIEVVPVPAASRIADAESALADGLDLEPGQHLGLAHAPPRPR